MRLLVALFLLAGCNGTAPAPAEPSPSEPAAPAPTAEPPSRADGAPDLGALPDLVHRAVNAARGAEGVPALGWSDALAAVAAAHSRDMAARGYFAHDTPEGTTPSERATADGVDCRIDLGGGRSRVGVAENLFQTTPYRQVQTSTRNGVATETVDWYAPPELADVTVDGWLESPGHRRNLLEPVSREHGIGVAVGGDDAVYITQVLC